MLDVIDSVFVSPQNLCVKTLTTNVMVLGSGIFGWWLSHEGRALMNLMNEMDTLIEETPESALAPSTMWRPSEKKVVCHPEETP